MRPEDKQYFLSLTNWQLMGLCIEREASGEPAEGRIAVGTVILERVDHRRWDGNTIHEVILWPWQFSWTMPQAGEDYYNESVGMAKHWPDDNVPLRECCEIANGLITGTIPRDPDLSAVNCCQYLNPHTAPDQYKKWLASGMTVVKKIGKHVFLDDHKGKEG